MLFANFRLSGKNPVSIDLLTHLVNTSKVNSHSLNILVGISAPKALLVLRSRMIFLTLSTDNIFFDVTNVWMFLVILDIVINFVRSVSWRRNFVFPMIQIKIINN